MSYKIEPIINKVKPPKTKLEWLREPLDSLSDPFRLLVFGSGGSGKSNMIMNLITHFLINPKTGKSIFTDIVVMTPTMLQDHVFELLKTESADVRSKTYITNELELDTIMTIINREKGLDRRFLFYIDDFGADVKGKEQAIALNHLFFRGRHSGNSMIISLQSFFSIKDEIRRNSTHIIHYAPSMGPKIPVLKYYLETPKMKGKDFDEMFEMATKDKYNFVFKNVAERKFYHNFEEELYVDDPNEPKEEEQEIEEFEPEEGQYKTRLDGESFSAWQSRIASDSLHQENGQVEYQDL